MSPLPPLKPSCSSLPGCPQLRPARGGRGFVVSILKCNQSEQREKLLIAVLAKFRERLSHEAAKLQEKSFSVCKDWDWSNFSPAMHAGAGLAWTCSSNCRLSESPLEPASSWGRFAPSRQPFRQGWQRPVVGSVSRVELHSSDPTFIFREWIRRAPRVSSRILFTPFL